MGERELSSNIWKLYLIRALRSFMMVMPIIVLFFKENGLSMKEIFLLQALFSVTVIFLEIPTGYFADIFGRKRSIVTGGVLAALGFFVYSQSFTFWWFLLAEMILGIGLSFISGSDSALLYDTLMNLEREGEYKKIEGRGLSVGLMSESVASVIGGLLALVSLRLPLLGDAIIMLLVFPVSLTLFEPERKMIDQKKNDLMVILRLVKFSLHEQKKLKWLIVHSSVVGASTLTMVWFIQPYLLATNVPLVFFGIFWAALLLTAAFFSWHAHDFERKMGRRNSLIILIVLPVLGYFILSSLWFVWSGIFVFLFYVTRGLNSPVTFDYINGLISSDVRATILSIRNLVGRSIFSVVGPVVGWLADVRSLQMALVVSGAVFLALGLISLVFLRKHEAL